MAITPETHPIKTALLSVSDKTGIVELAQQLQQRGVRIISTGGTASTLRNAGIEVIGISDITGFPEIMDGRVKTLHPAVHAGLLAVLDNPEHAQTLQEHGFSSIDLVVLNLYPFEQTRAKTGATHEEIIENIDIGGPAMIRASAKNYRWTVILTQSEQYATFLQQLDAHNGAIPEVFRKEYALKAFQHTANYDAAIAEYFLEAEQPVVTDRQQLLVRAQKALPLRYGENPHQQAALYGKYFEVYTPLFGKELSYNNILDIDGATRLVAEFSEQPTVAIIKHTNPCGIAQGENLTVAYRRAFESDRTSPFGGIIAVNKIMDIETAQAVDEIFTEVLIAPDFAPDALELLQKKKNRRLVKVNFARLAELGKYDIRSVAGGILVQDNDSIIVNTDSIRCVTKRQPTPEEYQSMLFAYTVAKHVKSNAIVYAHADRALAIGAGQMSRLDSAKIATQKAEIEGISLHGSAVASEAFFPFADGLLEVVKAGATAVIQPGGSIRDEEVIAAADENNITMLFTGIRHFKH